MQMQIDNFDVDVYFTRINYIGSKIPSFETLNNLCWSHVTHIPVDTLDIFNNQVKTLDLNSIYHNIIEKHRGGWCYELNGLFAVLLRALGYNVLLLEGSCYIPACDKFSAPYDHLYLKVILNKKEYIVDVAYGAPSFFQPMLFNFSPQTQMTGVYRFRKINDNEFYVEKRKKKLVNAITNEVINQKNHVCQFSVSDEWELISRFSGTARQWEDYAEANRNHQTDKNGFFMTNSFVEVFNKTGVDVLWGTKLLEKKFPDPLTEQIKHTELLPGATPSQANEEQKREVLELIMTKFGLSLDFWPNFKSESYSPL